MLFSKKFILHNLYYVKELFVFLLVCFSFFHFYKKKKFKKIFKVLKYIFLILIFVILFFFRNNLNILSKNVNEILSPSSSKVISIKEKQGITNIFTYLSPLDRHFAIAPVDCTIKSITKPLKDIDAERVKITCLDNNKDKFAVDLIVAKPMQGIGIFGGWVPKLFYKTRIVPLCKVGDKLKRGDRYGLIRFGSNMEYFFPSSWKLNFKEKEHKSVGSIIGKK
jgi:phosphatidylserine decarboxylase|tara:strand:- start:960 stop:1625 length:666 start_codon:yes stop_codon:yes gene_type:complete